ncbi:MAG: 30S ribosomal protein S4 [bacterium]|nr:30S ribosomal protein S4 [bacterium]
MARYRDPVCKFCRREGKKLFLKGTRCDTDKCAFNRRQTPPGETKRKFHKRESGYAIHLREKQKVKRIYGVLEHQFRHYFELATSKRGVTGEVLLQLLERRLDNVVYRLGFAPSRRAARQLVTHGHFLVNNHKIDIPSYLVKPGDLVSLKEKSQKLLGIVESLKVSREIPVWLSLDKANFKAEVKAIPNRENIPIDIREELIVELYSK